VQALSCGQTPGAAGSFLPGKNHSGSRSGQTGRCTFQELAQGVLQMRAACRGGTVRRACGQKTGL